MQCMRRPGGCPGRARARRTCHWTAEHLDTCRGRRPWRSRSRTGHAAARLGRRRPTCERVWWL